MKQQCITMTQQEVVRYEVIKKLIDKRINGTEAAVQIGVTVRQVKNIKARVIQEGIRGIVHKGRGRPSNRKIGEEKIRRIEKVVKEKYYDFGPTFAAEKLEEKHRIRISNETLRQLMSGWKLWKIQPRKQSKNIRCWRPRKDHCGEMEQFDGSYHRWLEDRAGELCLLVSVDDATGKITHAMFDHNESVRAVFAFWTEYFDIHGIPASIYLDKFSTYKINHKNAVDNYELKTQFERAMRQVGVQPITAHSPEAKGRVERMFETLQDRLVKEMRLARIATIADANVFLAEYVPTFNAQFAVMPNKKADVHRRMSASEREKLPQIFSIQSLRKINNDYTVMFKNQYLQLDRSQPTTVYKKDAVIVEEHLDGAIKVNLNGYYLNYAVLPERPKKQIDINLPVLTKRVQSNWKPPIDHPWRRSFAKNIQQKQAVVIN